MGNYYRGKKWWCSDEKTGTSFNVASGGLDAIESGTSPECCNGEMPEYTSRRLMGMVSIQPG